MTPLRTGEGEFSTRLLTALRALPTPHVLYMQAAHPNPNPNPNLTLIPTQTPTLTLFLTPHVLYMQEDSK